MADVHPALEAAEEAVRQIQRALAIADEGTRQAWEAQGHWKLAARFLKDAQAECEKAGRWPDYQVVRDENGWPTQLVWRPR